MIQQDPHRFPHSQHQTQPQNEEDVRRAAFTNVGLPYFNPHSFRNTIACLGETLCQTPEQFKAWSQNIGHEKVLTTFVSYGKVPTRRQGEILEHLKSPRSATELDVEKITKAVLHQLRHLTKDG